MTDDFIRYLQTSAEAFRLLAECYYLPSSDMKENADQLARCMDGINSPARLYANKMTETSSEEADLRALQVDFARLFVGPYKLLAPPYGSIYLEGTRQVMGDSSVDARKKYREAGLDISKNFKDAPDHIAVELEFMHYLTIKSVGAARDSDRERFGDFIHEQKIFLENHLGAWVSEFSDQVSESAETEYFRNLAVVTRLFISQHHEMISKQASDTMTLQSPVGF